MIKYTLEYKLKMVSNELANIFGVAPQALNLPNIDNYEALLHTLFAIEDIYGLTINTLDDELCLTLDHENSSYFAMYDMLKAWNKVARKYRTREITKEEYDNWRYNILALKRSRRKKYLIFCKRKRKTPLKMNNPKYCK